MQWIVSLFRDNQSVAHGLLVLGVVISTGFALGSVRVAGVGLGVGGVLFTGLVFGHLSFTIGHETMEFLREFGLVLFVYAMGLQVGPGFFSSLRREGLSLNLMSSAIVLGGTACAVVVGFLMSLDVPTIAGLLSGAVTNTPSLGAAQQALGDLLPDAASAKESVGLAYALAYPFGIVGIILTMLIVRRAFRIDPDAESSAFDKAQRTQAKPLRELDVEVTNTNLHGKTIEELMGLVGPGTVVSRLFRNGEQRIATPDAVMATGDVLHVVGSETRVEDFRVIVGRTSSLRIPSIPSRIHVRKIVVTNKDKVGKTIEALELEERYGVVVTRVIRSGVEFSASGGLRTQYGDRLTVVGEEQAVERAAKEVGDSVADLEKARVLPIFLGIALGVVLGSWPIAVPGMPVAVKLGLAGGPLIVAIILGRLGKVGPLLVYVPASAKILMRELGIALFLACVGLKSGERFFRILLSAQGLTTMLLGAVVTLVPLLAVAFWARWRRKLNYVSLCGLLAGSMTDPPALAYATQIVRNDAPSVAYATVYPLTMFLRVVLAQVVVLLLSR